VRRTALALIILGAVTLAGCASSGVVLVGADETYLIRTHDDIGLIGYARPLLTDLHSESQAFCLRTGRAAEPVKETESAGLPLLHGTTAELKFRCVAISMSVSGWAISVITSCLRAPLL
jgi:hypothetical protein